MKILRFPDPPARLRGVAHQLRSLDALLSEYRSRQTGLAAERERLRTSLDRLAKLGRAFVRDTERLRLSVARLRARPVRRQPPPPR